MEKFFTITIFLILNIICLAQCPVERAWQSAEYKKSKSLINDTTKVVESERFSLSNSVDVVYRLWFEEFEVRRNEKVVDHTGFHKGALIFYVPNNDSIHSSWVYYREKWLDDLSPIYQLWDELQQRRIIEVPVQGGTRDKLYYSCNVRSQKNAPVGERVVDVRWEGFNTTLFMTRIVLDNGKDCVKNCIVMDVGEEFNNMISCINERYDSPQKQDKERK